MTDLTEVLTIHLKAPAHVWPEEWRCRSRGENVYRGYQPSSTLKRLRDFPECLQMSMGWGGLRWWEPPSGSAPRPAWTWPRALSSGSHLAACLSWHRLGVREAAAAILTTLICFPDGAFWFILEYLRESLFPFPMVPERFLFGSVSIKAGLSSPIPQNSKREKNNLVAICL